MKIGFIGVGKLGKEASELISEKYYVEGYDINNTTAIGVKMVNTIEDVCQDKDIIFIAVPTPHHPDYDGRYPTSHLENKDFDYTIVKEVLKEVNKHTNLNQLVVLISTVLPGTIRREFIPLVENFRFIYNPYLIAMGTVKHDMINPEMLIIGTEDGSETGDAKLLTDFYSTFVDPSTRVEIGTWDEAEAIKIFYNTFISTKVALVNMIQDVAEKNGNINTDVVTGALARSTKRIVSDAYLKAGMGDGGGCHPRDNIALRYMAENLDLGYDLFDAIMTAREVQAKNIAKKLGRLSYEHNLPVVIMGKSYKPGVDYLEGSTSIMVGYYLEQQGYKVTYDSIDSQAVYLLGHYDMFVDTVFPTGSVILDPWRQRTDAVHYGNTRLNG